MAIDYGAMMALNEAIKGTSEARRARRQEETQMRNEMMQQEKLDFQNAEMIGQEQQALETSRENYLKQVQKIPHMRDYVNNYFDEKTTEFKGLIKSFNGKKTLIIIAHKKELINFLIVGKPNSGKSTFYNTLNDKYLSPTGPESGLTKDIFKNVAIA